jgi:hypothetical protein
MTDDREAPNANPNTREKIVALVEQLIGQHADGGPANRVAAKLMRSWLDLNTNPPATT